MKKVTDLRGFAVVGLTEKELGDSVFDAMVKIARLRTQRDAAEIGIPIHIFGSLDALTSVLYFLAGAEIFDGLTWLRFGYQDGRTLYSQNYGVLRDSEGLRRNAYERHFDMWRNNYYYLGKLRTQMINYEAYQRPRVLRTVGIAFERCANAASGNRVGGELKMGGSGSRGFFEKTPADIKAEMRKEEERTLDQAFEVEVAARVEHLLETANKRDVNAIQKALGEVKLALAAEIEGTIGDPIFGGSVRKRTYVNGISDVDTLIVLKDPHLRSSSPQQVLEYFEAQVRQHLKGWEVSRGTLSVTLIKQGLEIQILPAVREDGSTHIPSARGNQWSEINPEKFFSKLTEINNKLANKVVPVIKLAKIINFQQPEALQLSGYHLESLAVEFFNRMSDL